MYYSRDLAELKETVEKLKGNMSLLKGNRNDVGLRPDDIDKLQKFGFTKDYFDKLPGADNAYYLNIRKIPDFFSKDIGELTPKIPDNIISDNGVRRKAQDIITKFFSTEVKTQISIILKNSIKSLIIPPEKTTNIFLQLNKESDRYQIYKKILDKSTENDSFNESKKIKLKEIKKYFRQKIDDSYNDIIISFDENDITNMGLLYFKKSTFSRIIISINIFIESIKNPQQKKWGKMLLGIGATSIIVSLFGGVVYLSINSKSSKNQVEQYINQQIEESAEDQSGCFLVDKSTGKSFKVDLLSCNKTTSTTNDNSLQTCSLSDTECTNKFNPCLRDPSNPIPPDCKRLVVSSLSGQKGMNEYLACSEENKYCSKYCEIENFNYDRNRYEMECRNVDINILKLKFVSLISGVPVSTLLDRLLLKSGSVSSIVKIWIINLILLVLIVYKIYISNF